MKDPWVIWSYEHDSWWAPNSCGYRTSLLLAGVYTEAEAKKIEASANQYPNLWLVTNTNPEGKHEIAMPLEEAVAFDSEGHSRQGTVGQYLTVKQKPDA